MRVRIIVLILSVICLLTISIGGFLYYRSLKRSTIAEAHQRAENTLELIAHNILSRLDEYEKTARVLAGLDALEKALTTKDMQTVKAAHRVLDHFTGALKVSVCYLMDETGTTIATSNRNSEKSFLLKNYGFRPYFKKAMNGHSAIYLALGVTSGQRGAYFSYPVYSDVQKEPVGVAVVKASMDRWEQEYLIADEGEILLTTPHGMVFLSSRKAWLFKTLKQSMPQEIQQIVHTRQFGNGPWEPVGFKKFAESGIMDPNGDRYRLHRTRLSVLPGWGLLYLHSAGKMAQYLSGTELRSIGLVIVGLCVLLGLSVFFLYRKAHHEIIQKRRADEETSERQKFQGSLETAGAICHELNQPLQSVMTYAELMKQSVSIDHLMYGYLNNIIDQVKRMGGITNKLMSITTYKTKEYLHGRKILDIDGASTQDVGTDS